MREGRIRKIPAVSIQNETDQHESPTLLWGHVTLVCVEYRSRIDNYKLKCNHVVKQDTGQSRPVYTHLAARPRGARLKHILGTKSL